MANWRTYIGAAAGIAVLGAVLSLSGTVPALAQGPLRPLEALIINENSDPVPVSVATPLSVSVQSPVVTTPPLWQGIPTVESELVLNPNANGFEFCQDVFAAEAGTAVLLNNIVVSFNVPPGGGGSAIVRLTLPDGTVTSSISIPAQRTAGASQAAGIYDQFVGSLDVNGFPATAAEACLSGITSRGRFNFIGFTVPLPE